MTNIIDLCVNNSYNIFRRMVCKLEMLNMYYFLDYR